MNENKYNVDNHERKFIKYVKIHEDNSINDTDDFIILQKHKIKKHGLISTY